MEADLDAKTAAQKMMLRGSQSINKNGYVTNSGRASAFNKLNFYPDAGQQCGGPKDDTKPSTVSGS